MKSTYTTSNTSMISLHNTLPDGIVMLLEVTRTTTTTTTTTTEVAVLVVRRLREEKKVFCRTGR